MVTLKKLKELKQIKRDNKVIYNLLNTIIGECEQISKDPIDKIINWFKK